MTVFGVKTTHTITAQAGKRRNTIGYSGVAREQYIINYSRGSVNTHRTETFIRRLLGR